MPLGRDARRGRGRCCPAGVPLRLIPAPPPRSGPRLLPALPRRPRGRRPGQDPSTGVSRARLSPPPAFPFSSQAELPPSLITHVLISLHAASSRKPSPTPPAHTVRAALGGVWPSPALSCLPAWPEALLCSGRQAVRPCPAPRTAGASEPAGRAGSGSADTPAPGPRAAHSPAHAGLATRSVWWPLPHTGHSAHYRPSRGGRGTQSGTRPTARPAPPRPASDRRGWLLGPRSPTWSMRTPRRGAPAAARSPRLDLLPSREDAASSEPALIQTSIADRLLD